MMKPHEILQALGFDIPEEGIEINPHDAFLFHSSLKLAGATIDVARIPDADLVAQWNGLPGAPAPTEHTAARQRQIVELNLIQGFKFKGA